MKRRGRVSNLGLNLQPNSRRIDNAKKRGYLGTHASHVHYYGHRTDKGQPRYAARAKFLDLHNSVAHKNTCSRQKGQLRPTPFQHHFCEIVSTVNANTGDWKYRMMLKHVVEHDRPPEYRPSQYQPPGPTSRVPTSRVPTLSPKTKRPHHAATPGTLTRFIKRAYDSFPSVWPGVVSIVPSSPIDDNLVVSY